MTKTAIIAALTILLISCAPALQSVHENVYNKFIPISDMEMWGKSDYRATRAERWIKGYMYGDCDEFAAEVMERAQALGMDAEYVEVWRNLDGKRNEWHAVAIYNGYVSDNRLRWVIKESDFFKEWMRKDSY